MSKSKSDRFPEFAEALELLMMLYSLKPKADVKAILRRSVPRSLEEATRKQLTAFIKRARKVIARQ